jgi:hypothetical protein
MLPTQAEEDIELARRPQHLGRLGIFHVLEFVKMLGEQKEVSLYFEHARKELSIFR